MHAPCAKVAHFSRKGLALSDGGRSECPKLLDCLRAVALVGDLQYAEWRKSHHRGQGRMADGVGAVPAAGIPVANGRLPPIAARRAQAPAARRRPPPIALPPPSRPPPSARGLHRLTRASHAPSGRVCGWRQRTGWPEQVMFDTFVRSCQRKGLPAPRRTLTAKCSSGVYESSQSAWSAGSRRSSASSLRSVDHCELL